MIRINENDFGLNDLAGLALTYLDGHDLPQDLYVYGLSDQWPAATYVDPQIQNAERVAAFIATITNEPAMVGLPTRPRVRPAIGLARRLRTPHSIEMSTRLAVLTLFAINNRINFTIPAYQFLVNDMVHYPRGGEIASGVITEINGDAVRIRNRHTGVVHVSTLVLLDPVRPDDRNQRTRPLMNSPTYADGAERLDRLTTAHVGVVYAIQNNTVHYIPDNTPYRGQGAVAVDINCMVRVA